MLSLSSMMPSSWSISAETVLLETQWEGTLRCNNAKTAHPVRLCNQEHPCVPEREERRDPYLPGQCLLKSDSAPARCSKLKKVKYTRLGVNDALATHQSGTSAPRETLPRRIVRKGCSSPDSNAGPRDCSKLPYRTWYPWAAGSCQVQPSSALVDTQNIRAVLTVLASHSLCTGL